MILRQIVEKIMW